jgi:hypothetical protein
MVDLFRKSDIMIHKFWCGELLTSIESRLRSSKANLPKEDSFLTESRSGPNTDMSNVKVATLSMTFQNWSRLAFCALSTVVKAIRLF